MGWKYEVDGNRAGAIRLAEQQIAECRTDACVANGSGYGEGFGLVRGGGAVAHLPDTAALFAALEEFLRERSAARSIDLRNRPRPMKPSKFSRRRFLRGSIALRALLAVADAAWVEPKWVKTRRFRLGSGKPTHRVVHFTDVHHKGDRAYLEAVVRKINALSPDFVCFTGDLIEETETSGRRPWKCWPGSSRRSMACRATTITGARPPSSRIAKCFAATGGAWLLDEQRETGDGKFTIIGATCLAAPTAAAPGQPRHPKHLPHALPGLGEEAWRAEI